MNWNEKRIIITGGSSGIGKACALECAKRGAHTAILGLDPAKITATVALIKNQTNNPHVTGYVCDVGEISLIKATLPQIIKDLGCIDVLINNAGYTTYETFAELSVDEIDRMTRVNYLGAVIVSKIVLDEMMKRRLGHVINVGSVAGKLPITPNGVYCAAKHGLTTITELLSYEYQPFNIHFSLLLPGRVDTAFFDHETFKTREHRPETQGMLSPESVGAALVKMIEKKSKFVVMPYRFKFIFWLNSFLPWFFKPCLKWLLVKRVREHYDHVGWPQN